MRYFQPSTLPALALGASLLLVACESDSRSGGGTDAGSRPTPTVDAGTGTPLPPTPGTDAGTSTPPTPGTDAGTSTPPTPGTDAGTGGSGSIDGPDPRPGYVGCGDTSCASPQVCCVDLSGQTCTASDGCGGGFSAAGACDGPEDCESGSRCCVHFGMFDPSNGASCQPSACPSGDYELCSSDADCGAGATCQACAPPTGGILDVVYGVCSTDGSCPGVFTAAP